MGIGGADGGPSGVQASAADRAGVLDQVESAGIAPGIERVFDVEIESRCVQRETIEAGNDQ